MAEDIEQKVKITYETNADEVSKEVEGLSTSQDDVVQSSKKVAEVKATETKAMTNSAEAVSKNGGAMGILNLITGGYAQIVKDAMEATQLFTRAQQVETVTTEIATTATVSNNTATQLGILSKIKDAAAWVALTVAQGLAIVALGVVTAAQWLWNVAVVANPLVAFVVAIIATIAAIYKLTTFLIDSSKANDAAAEATRKNTIALEKQSEAADKSSKALKINNDFIRDMAKANGKSTEELRKMNLKHAEEEVLLIKKNTLIARATFLRERDTLALLKAADASDEVIAGQEKLTQASFKDFENQNGQLKKAVEDRNAVIRSNAVEVASEATKRRQDELKATEKHNADLAALNKKKLEDRLKAEKEAADELERLRKLRLSSEEMALRTIQDVNDKSDEEKLARKKERDLQAINQLAQQGIDVRNLLIYNDELYATLENELAEKRATEKAEKEKKAYEDETEAKNKQRDEDLAAEQAVADAKNAIQNAQLDNVSKGIGLLSSLGIKSKSLQKGLVIAENAAGIAKTVINTMAANAKAIAASPLTGGQPFVTANTISGSIGVATSIAATAKALSALGGGGGSSSTSAIPNNSGGSNSTPQVTFQGSSENQIGNAFARNQAEQPIIKTYVVESEMTAQQDVANNRLSANSFG